MQLFISCSCIHLYINLRRSRDDCPHKRKGSTCNLNELDSIKNSDFTNFEVGLYFRDRCAHCIRDESRLFGSQAPGAPDASGMTTSVRNVGPSANSAL